MTARFAVVDTNVIFSGFLTRDVHSPTAQILDGMLRGRFRFLLSGDLLTEYRTVLLRAPIRRIHGLTSEQIDQLLAAIAANATIREPEPRATPTDRREDEHLWRLTALYPGATLVTGDRALSEVAPRGTPVLSPRRFLTLIENATKTLGTGKTT